VGQQVDTSTEQTVSTDSLGRRTGPRQSHTIEEKLRIVQETHVRGASVASVARRHNINPNQIFAWRQLYRRGLLSPGASKAGTPMLPVKVSTPTVLPTERARATSVGRTGRAGGCELIEIKLRNGHSIELHGAVDPAALRTVLDLLVRR
jgi:transposase-like protein